MIRIANIYEDRNHLFAWVTGRGGVGLHRLVWETLRGPIPKKHAIHHIDGNGLNNDITNLCCLPLGEHRRLHSGKHSPETRAKLAAFNRAKVNNPAYIEKLRLARLRTVRCIETGQVFTGTEAAGETIGVTGSAIVACIRGGPHRTSGGYHWEYLS